MKPNYRLEDKQNVDVMLLLAAATNCCCTMLLCVVDAVSAFWQNHSSEFPSLSVLQSCIGDVRRRLMLNSSADADDATAAGEQRNSSSTESDDVN